MTIRPKRRHKNTRRAFKAREHPKHRQWVRGFECCVTRWILKDLPCGGNIVFAHVRDGITDFSERGGIGLKPDDRHGVPMCLVHHTEQHALGEARFERKYGIDLTKLAQGFAKDSPYRHEWESK